MNSSHPRRRWMAALAASAALTVHPLFAASLQMNVQVDQPGAKINPSFYGLMTEEISHSYDGGLYAELIQNRVFKDNSRDPIHWSLVQEGGGVGTMSLNRADPVNPALSVSLKLEVTTGGQRVGVANEGFCNFSKRPGGRVVGGAGGIPIKPNTTYKVTFYAKGSPSAGPLTVSLESNDGQTKFAQAPVGAPSSSWRKFQAELKTGPGLTPSLDNRFVISTNKPGTIWLSFVSLFPPTYKNRPNGNRIDLMEKLVAMKPAFLRFPGGNYVDPGHYIWKNTIGPVDQRPGNPGAWDYRTCEGLGLLEFFLWCEEMNMEPILAVSVGRPWLPANGDVMPLVQDALDEIEYATGDASTKWGAKRAADGHPAPFKLRYVEIGNEDFFDKKETYEARFPKFFDAIKAKYPQLKCIATRRDMYTRVPDLIDDHIYAKPMEMARAGAAYDNYDRKKPKIFVGEWATQDGNPTPTLRGALGDAAYLTGLERNADVIEIACYAPLFVNVNPNGSQWNTNLIGYDALNSFGSPSYYMQVMFNHNKGDVVLPVEVSATDNNAAPPAPQGGIGVGTFETQAEFKDVKVTRGQTVLLQSASSADRGNVWQPQEGDWKVRDGAFAQSSNRRFARAMAGDASWGDYTYNVKARKISGTEGFLIYFHVKDDANFIFWNLGGWGNDHSGLEVTIDGDKQALGATEPVTIETGRWYDIQIEVKGRQIRCSLDGKLITQAVDPIGSSKIPLYTSATRDQATGDVILKVVNLKDEAHQTQINLKGAGQIAPNATALVLTGDPGAVNSIAEPEKIAPKTVAISNAGNKFDHEFPANSVTVLRLKTK